MASLETLAISNARPKKTTSELFRAPYISPLYPKATARFKLIRSEKGKSSRVQSWPVGGFKFESYDVVLCCRLRLDQNIVLLVAKRGLKESGYSESNAD